MRKSNFLISCLYIALLVIASRALFHGFPDIERFFPEWMDERRALTFIIKFGTLNFAPTDWVHPPLYHYLTFIPVGLFYVFGKILGFFSDKVDFVRFYFNNTQYFFLIGRLMSYIFYWLTALMIYKIIRLNYNKKVSNLTTFAFLLIPRFISDFATTRPDTLLMLTSSVFFYFLLKYYQNESQVKFLYLSAFILGIASATKFNAIFLVFFLAIMFIHKLIILRKDNHAQKIALSQFLAVGFFIFLGFAIFNPYYVIRFKTYLYNLYIFDALYTKYCRLGYSTSVFLLSRLKDISSNIYLNYFGLAILALGGLSWIKKDRKLFLYLLLTFLVFESYFSLRHKYCSPTYYLNPLLPMAALIFAGGINFLVEKKNIFKLILLFFFVTALFNYLVFLRDISKRPTYLQEARYFIEQTIPEFSKICVASKSNLPQLNMTRASYFHLIATAPKLKSKVKNINVSFIPLDNENEYDSRFRELRIASLTKKPQYNLIRWDGDIKNEVEARNFLEKNNIEYIICNGPVFVGNKELGQTELVFLVRDFGPNNRIVYEDNNFYIYKVNYKR